MKTKVEKRENLKNRLQVWKEKNEIEYENFTNSIYAINSTHYKEILKIAKSIYPKYINFLNKQIYKREEIDIESLQEKFILKDSNYLEKIFSNNSKSTIPPALLYWLYFDYSYEFMVEKLELLRMNDNANFFQKQFLFLLIKAIKLKSIKDGFRTKEDWKKHNDLLIEISSNYPINFEYKEKKQRGRKKGEIKIDEKYHDFIRKYLIYNKSATDIAYLKIALEEINKIEVKAVNAFREYIINEIKIEKVINVTGIQKVYGELTSKDSMGNYFKDKKDNRIIIDKIKNELNKI